MSCEQSMLELQSRFDGTCSGQRLEARIQSLIEKEKSKDDSASLKIYKTKMFLWTFARSEQDWLKNYENTLLSHEEVISKVILSAHELNNNCKLSRKRSRELLNQVDELIQYYDTLQTNNSYIQNCIKVIEDIEYQYREGL
ncbi:MAG: hypothetical protein MK008_12810 [Bdellovibrionales bacterium]|nr:hypothetical protein [Bdellovibrionales bacterium]